MKLMLDTFGYKSKPTTKQIRDEINNRIIHNPVDIEPKQLAQEIAKGKSFIPGYMIEVNGIVKRRIENWQSQQIIALDFDNGMKLEDAINEFKDSAMFIYTTFNHSNKQDKFRVVFALDEAIGDYELLQFIMNEYENKYPIDKKCKDGSRLFFGGNDIIELDYNNRVDVNELRIKYYDKDKKGVSNRSKVIKYNSIGYTKNPLSIINNIDNIIYIKNRDISILHSILQPIDITFHTHEEVYNHLAQQNLYDYLGINQSHFSCIFHEDNNPSANIFVNEENGHYIYKCHSEKCSFGTGGIRKVTERLLSENKVRALSFLRKVYKIDYYETDWQKEQKELIDENIRYLMSDDFKLENPELYKVVGKYICDLTLIHNVAKENLPAETYTEEQIEHLFFASVRHLSNLAGQKNHKRLADRISLFAYLGMLFKLNEEDIPKPLLKEAKRQLMKSKEKLGAVNMNLISFFSIPSYSDDTLSYSKEKAKEYKEKHLTMKGWSRELLLRSLGESEANRVYPQFKGRKIGKLNETISMEMEKLLLELMDDKGYVLEKEIIDKGINIYGSKQFKQTQFKRSLPEILDKYGLMRMRLNKEIKKKMNIDIRGYPFIIVKE